MAALRLAIVASHPVQYYAPIYRELARQLDITVFYVHRDSAADQARAGFGVEFAWDVDLLAGYNYRFVENIARSPGLGRFAGVDTPGIGRALRDGRFDAVLVMGWYLKALVQAIVAAKLARIPVMVRGDSQLGTPRSRLIRLSKQFAYPSFLRLFDAALYVGVRSRQYYEHYRFPSGRLFSSPHCIDTKRFASAATAEARIRLRSRLGIDEGERVVLFAGKLVDFKRPLDCVDGVAELRRRHHRASVLVAGAGALEAALKARAGEGGVPLRCLGFKNQSEMPEVYAAADALVLPSSARETWGLVCNEALACGCPIVVSDAVGCAPDLAADGDVGRTYPMGDTTKLADALDALLGSPPARTAISRVSDRYAVAASVAGIVEAVRFVSRTR